MRRSTIAILLLASAGLAGIAGKAEAQRQRDYRLELNFSNPGARSLALGGAFVAVADDATAAYANPAGLSNLSRPEVSVEGRSWKYTHVYTTGGHAYGALSNIGVDTTAGLVQSEASDTAAGVSFLSFVYPVKNFSFALYRHELANFEANVETQGLFFNAYDLSVAPNELIFRFRPTRTRAEADIVNYGLSGSWKINDRFSAGVGVSYYDFSLDVQTRRYGLKPVQGGAPGEFFGPADFSDANQVNVLQEEGDDTDVGFNVGLLWKVTDNWSLGAVYRQSAEFDSTVTITPSPLAPETEPFLIPEVFAFGTAFKPTQQVTVSVDLNHINWSDSFGEEANVRIDDADELHFGLEYLLLTKVPVSLRAGAWYDPDHQASYRILPDATNEQRAQSIRFPRGEDDWHYAGGLGLVIGEDVQIDAAFDLSDRIDTFSLSSVYRF